MTPEMLRWILDSQEDHQLKVLAKEVKATVSGFRSPQTAPRNPLIHALMKGNYREKIIENLPADESWLGQSRETLEKLDESVPRYRVLVSLLKSPEEEDQQNAIQLFESWKEQGLPQVTAQERGEQRVQKRNVEKSTKIEQEQNEINKVLKKKNNRLQKMGDQLKRESITHEKEYRENLRQIQSLNQNLAQQNEGLLLKNQELTQYNENLNQKIQKLTKQIEKLNQKNEELAQQNENLTQKNKELGKQLQSLPAELLTEQNSIKLKKEQSNNPPVKLSKNKEMLNRVLIGNRTFQKLADSTQIQLLQEKDIQSSPEVLLSAGQILVPSYAVSVITMRNLKQIDTSKILFFENFTSLKSYLEGNESNELSAVGR